MLELLLCSLFTVVPDYLYRRYGQGKRVGKEITLYSVWFELRWGLTTCLMLTIALITVIFYYHPSTSNVTALYRTVPIVPEGNGRVAEVHVAFGSDVKEGQPLFKLDDVFLEPLYEGGLDGVTPGSSCVANAYSNNHDLLASKDIGWFRWLYWHGVDTVAIVHAMLLRVQALLLPVKTLVLSGH